MKQTELLINLENLYCRLQPHLIRARKTKLGVDDNITYAELQMFETIMKMIKSATTTIRLIKNLKPF